MYFPKCREENKWRLRWTFQNHVKGSPPQIVQYIDWTLASRGVADYIGFRVTDNSISNLDLFCSKLNHMKNIKTNNNVQSIIILFKQTTRERKEPPYKGKPRFYDKKINFKFNGKSGWHASKFNLTLGCLCNFLLIS